MELTPPTPSPPRWLKPGDKFLYKSAAGFWCNAIIKDYMPKNIFITAEKGGM